MFLNRNHLQKVEQNQCKPYFAKPMLHTKSIRNRQLNKQNNEIYQLIFVNRHIDDVLPVHLNCIKQSNRFPTMSTENIVRTRENIIRIVRLKC